MTAPGDLPPWPPEQPPVPPGPGAVPPFVAPPVDRDHRRLWIGLGVGAVLVVVCCVVGVLGGGLLLGAGARQVQNQARDTVAEYLGDLRSGDYASAYQLICPAATKNLTLNQFTVARRKHPVTAFVVGDVTDTDNELVVTAQVTYQDLGARSVDYLVVYTDSAPGVCGER